MPFRIDHEVVWLEGHCTAEDAQPLFDALRGVDCPIFDVGNTRSLHTAIVQIVLASQGGIRGALADPVLAACLRGRALPASAALPASEAAPLGSARRAGNAKQNFSKISAGL